MILVRYNRTKYMLVKGEDFGRSRLDKRRVAEAERTVVRGDR
jgi:hypothetical protein